MTVYWQSEAGASVEKIEASKIRGDIWHAQGDQVDVCNEDDCGCRTAPYNRTCIDDSEAKAIIGLIQEHYESREDLR